ncbi:MAG: RHS repeat-associated core domain-containing protein [Kiritimatiellia bacterium]
MTSESLHGPYDHHGCATEATVAFRVTNICTLDHRHRLAELRSGNAAPVHYGYDSENRHSVVSNTAFRATYAYTSDGRTNGLSVSRTRLTGLSNALRACVETEADGATTRVATSFDPVAKVSTDTLERTGMATTTRKRMFGREIEATDADGVTRYNYFDPYGRVYLTREFTGERFHWRTLAMRDSVGDIYASARFIGGTPYWNNVAQFNGFDSRGNLVASTNEMGYVTHSLFDSAGRLAARFGAAYPVAYGYDATGRLKSLFTTRSGATWDVTHWNYDPATGLVTNKVYADGSALAHGWTPDGLPERTTWARGAWRHVAYNDRRLPAAVSYSDPGTPGHELSYDAFGRLVAVADAAGRRHGYAYGASAASPTNETVAADSATNAIARILDANSRPVSTTLRVNDAPRGGTWHAYADSGRLAHVAATNAQGRGLVAAYTNFAGRSFGHSVELPSGAVFTRTLARDAYRPNRVTSIAHAFDGVEVSRYAHTFDALDRLAVRNADAFSYNARSEVVSATVASNEYAYAYDHIGNHTASSVNSDTTTFEANALNQYTSLSNLVQSCNPVHDLDGNLLANGVWSYTWDCENRLVTASSNNVCVVSNAYDYLSRRVLKATPEAVHAFVYDGWNLIHETVTAGNGDVSEIQYFWGPDLSGTLQGAGGVGGLLAVSINGQFYLPCVDNNGNIAAYVGESGSIVAEYVYDAYGGTIAASGSMSDTFRHRFSTKYYDAETGLYYYGCRFYDPVLHRWLNRDPIQEKGGANLYAFCGNNGINIIDLLGKQGVTVYRIHAIGDSMTYGVRTKTDPLMAPKDPLDLAHRKRLENIQNQGWRVYLKQKLDRASSGKAYRFEFSGNYPASDDPGNIRHDGYPGDKAGKTYERIQRGQIVCKEDDIYILLIGMNDALNLGAQLANGAKKADINPALSAMTGIATSIRQDDPALFLWGKIPYITDLAMDRNLDYVPANVNLPIKYINQHVGNEASFFGATVFDLQNLFIDNPSFTDDGFHFSDAGNRHVASLLAEIIQNKIGQLHR